MNQKRTKEKKKLNHYFFKFKKQNVRKSYRLHKYLNGANKKNELNILDVLSNDRPYSFIKCITIKFELFHFISFIIIDFFFQLVLD